MCSKEELIYNLIFSDYDLFEINICDYIEDIYQYDIFIDEIKSILRRSKVMIISEKISSPEEEKIIWELKVRK